MAHRVLIASFKHETNTFSNQPADLAAYEARVLYRGDQVREMHAGTKVEMAAYLDAADALGWEIVTPVSASATPSGPVTEECFETITGEILDAIDADGPFDAVLLALHGAMVTSHLEDGEGELLRRVRARVGGDVPIGVSLDLHANVTRLMAENADVMIAFRTYPHVDGYETAEKVAARIAGVLNGNSRPTTTVAQGAMLDGVDHGRTTSPGPMLEILDIADAIAAREEGVLDITINAGFPWTDIRDVGPTVMVVGEGTNPRHKEIADEIIQEIWKRRNEITIAPVTPAEAMARIAELGAGADDDRAAGSDGKAIVLADFADNPGGGGHGDATGLLAAMIEADLRDAAFSMLYDPEAVEICIAAGIDAEVALALGGKIDPDYGAPLQVTARVEAVTDGVFRYEGPMSEGALGENGPSVRIAIGGIQVCVSSRRAQALDRQHFRHFGVEPETKSILAVKSAQHFRAAFEPIAREVIVVDGGGGLTSRNYRALNYTRVRRPVFPLDLE
jgi:microcystin degradation protein MlrC